VRGEKWWEEMAGEEAGRHPEERSGQGKRLVGYCEERLDWKVEVTRKEGRQVQRKDQDRKLSSWWDLARLTP
jgi:hypothetical protein